VRASIANRSLKRPTWVICRCHLKTDPFLRRENSDAVYHWHALGVRGHCILTQMTCQFLVYHMSMSRSISMLTPRAEVRGSSWPRLTVLLLMEFRDNGDLIRPCNYSEMEMHDRQWSSEPDCWRTTDTTVPRPSVGSLRALASVTLECRRNYPAWRRSSRSP
jgi:hypothetical protein